MSRTLEARAFADTDGWWTIEIPELTTPTFRALTSSPTARGIGRQARELAALVLEVDEDDITIDVTIVVPDDIAELWSEGEEAERAAREAVIRAAGLRREAVRRLRASGYTAEAAASALGVSRQRIQQLTPTDNVASRPWAN